MNETLNYYNEHAKEYVEQTIKGIIQEQYNKFLKYIPDNGYILDFGCGSGRDSKYFLEHGYKVKAIDGSREICKLASEYIGQEVECMTFQELNEEDTYDGIWACSSLLHVKREELSNIILKIVKAIKKTGIIYISMKVGDKEEIIDGKYYNYVTKEILENILKEIEPKVYLVEYFETGTFDNINRPSTLWGNYLIKRR